MTDLETRLSTALKAGDAQDAKKKRGRPKKAGPLAPVVDLVKIETDIGAQRAIAETRLAQLNAFPLDTQERIDLFGKLLIAVRQGKDELEEQRKTITGPLNAAKKAVDALFKPMKDLLDAQDKTITDRLGPVLQARRQDQAKALTAVGEGSRDAAVLATAHDPSLTPEGLTDTVEYVLEIVDEAAIPRAFLAFDEALALKYVKHKKGQCEIPGVRILQRPTFRRVGGAA